MDARISLVHSINATDTDGFGWKNEGPLTAPHSFMYIRSDGADDTRPRNIHSIRSTFSTIDGDLHCDGCVAVTVVCVFYWTLVSLTSSRKLSSGTSLRFSMTRLMRCL